MEKPNYIKMIREKAGHDKIFLNFACICLVNEKGEILLQKRSADGEVWGFPGGALELGESAAEAAIREVEEETGLKSKIVRLVGVYTKYFAAYPNGDESQNVVVLFSGSIESGNLKVDNQETFGLRFFSPDSLPVLFNEQHQDMLKDYLSGKSGFFR